jgi:hypothetical protein
VADVPAPHLNAAATLRADDLERKLRGALEPTRHCWSTKRRLQAT